MRIVTGQLKGRSITFSKNITSHPRPTTGKIREAIFSKLSTHVFNNIINDAVFCDICCGTGIMAFEALSRGAKHAILVEKDNAVANTIRANIKNLNINDKTQILNCDASILPHIEQKCDIAYLDPPYPNNICTSLLNELHKKKWLQNEAIVICEMHITNEIKIPESYLLLEKKSYGNSKMIFLKYQIKECDAT